LVGPEGSSLAIFHHEKGPSLFRIVTQTSPVPATSKHISLLPPHLRPGIRRGLFYSAQSCLATAMQANVRRRGIDPTRSLPRP
jgi:hypothetical protein